MGEVGFGFNGVAIFNPYDRYCCDAGLYELRKILRFLVTLHEFHIYRKKYRNLFKVHLICVTLIQMAIEVVAIIITYGVHAFQRVPENQN